MTGNSTNRTASTAGCGKRVNSNYSDPFTWEEYALLEGQGVQVCYWYQCILMAHPDGRWSVQTEYGDLTTSEQQVKGKDIQEAQTRAQAAAIPIQHVLSDNPKSHGQ